jgi:RNA polymerase sigma-70 factor (ECF subfamily)
LEDEQLVKCLAADLDASFDVLVLTYQTRLFGFALRLTGNPQDAEEIAQDAFVRAYRALQGYPCERVMLLALRPWLFRIALNVARNRARGRRLRLVRLAEQDGEPRDEAATLLANAHDGPEAAAERAALAAQLAALVAALPPRYRAAVVLRHVEGLSYREVADVLGQPIGSAKANVHRGVQLLRAAISQDTDGVARQTAARRGE